MILSFDFVYPRRLTGRGSNGQEISLDVCPDDQDSIQMSFGVDEVKLYKSVYYSPHARTVNMVKKIPRPFGQWNSLRTPIFFLHPIDFE